MDELLQEFVAETGETLESLGEELVNWEHDPTDSARLDAIFRFFHTVKGSCGFLNLPRFEALSHAAEDILSGLRDGRYPANPDMVSAILALVDRIGALNNALADGNSDAGSGAPVAHIPNDDAVLIAALRASVEQQQPRSQNQSEPVDEPSLVSEPGVEPDASPDEIDAAQATDRTPARRTIRISLDLLDELMSGVSDMVLARNEVARCLREQSNDGPITGAFDRLSASVAEMRETIGKTRMEGVDRIFAPLPRLVRDVSRELGKQVVLVNNSNNVELDREMIELIRDPVIHIVRNAIDHGFETPEKRIAAGKPPEGRLQVSARQSGNQIVLEIDDDGAGVALDRLAAKAIAAKTASFSDVQRMSDEQKLDLIYAPGLSTANEVTHISGRGVGMDVVRTNIERVGGAIDLVNRPGAGLKVVLRLPLTLTIIACLTLEAGGQQFALPRSAVREILFETNDQVRIVKAGGNAMVYVRGEAMPIVRLDRTAGLEPADLDGEERTLVTIHASEGMRYALLIDRVIDHEELVIRPGAPPIMATGLYAGATLPDNGRPMLLLDALGIATAAQLSELPVEQRVVEQAATDDGLSVGADADRVMMVFTQGDGALRAVALAVVERIIEVKPDAFVKAGGQRRLVRDDAAWPVFGDPAKASENAPTDELTTNNKIKLLQLSDGFTRVYYPVAEIINVVPLSSAMQPASEPGLIAGIALLAGEPVEVLDAHWLFAAYQAGHSMAVQGQKRPTCRLRGRDNAWMRTILAPLVESTGYAIVWDDDDADAEAILTIAGPAEGQEPIAADQPPSGRMIHLVNQPDSADAQAANAIYRYDRAALVEALREALNRREDAA